MTPQAIQADAAGRLGATWRGQAQIQPPTITISPERIIEESEAADGLTFSELEIRAAVDDPKNLPRDRATSVIDKHSDAPPSAAYGLLIAIVIVIGAGSFGVVTSWVMAHVPKDAPHPAYVAELRHR